MKLEKHQRLTATQCEQRALAALSMVHPCKAATVADAIWPGHRMRRQGAGAAAARILVRLARWESCDGDWGWIAMPKGETQPAPGE